MLEEAVIPPYEDHTYAQWMQREEAPMSPQPSPFKKHSGTPIKFISPGINHDHDCESFS